MGQTHQTPKKESGKPTEAREAPTLAWFLGTMTGLLDALKATPEPVRFAWATEAAKLISTLKEEIAPAVLEAVKDVGGQMAVPGAVLTVKARDGTVSYKSVAEALAPGGIPPAILEANRGAPSEHVAVLSVELKTLQKKGAAA